MIRLSFAISLLLLPLCDAESSSSPFFSFLRWERKRAQPDDSWIARLLRRFPGETADALRSAARHLRAERWVVDAGACSLEVDNFQLVCAENEEEGSGVDDAAGNYSSSSSSSSSNSGSIIAAAAAAASTQQQQQHHSCSSNNMITAAAPHS